MSKVEKHLTDKGKYQSTFDNYGHGEGNGKSKTAIYKHFKTLENQEEEIKQEVESDEMPDWENMDWLNPDEEDLVSSTIPNAIKHFAVTGNAQVMTEAHRQTQRQLVRWGFIGVDRGISHWGRGVTSNPKYEIKRSQSDYEAMEAATTHLMDANGIHINLSPSLVFATVMGAAYVPPIVDISRNADPKRKLGIVRRITGFFKRRKNKKITIERDDKDGK